MAGIEQPPYAYNVPAGVIVGISSGLVVAANSLRELVYIINDSDQDVYLAVNSTALMNKGTLIRARGGIAQWGGYAGLPLTRDAINGICASGGANVTVQEANK